MPEHRCPLAANPEKQKLPRNLLRCSTGVLALRLCINKLHGNLPVAAQQPQAGKSKLKRYKDAIHRFHCRITVTRLTSGNTDKKSVRSGGTLCPLTGFQALTEAGALLS